MKRIVKKLLGGISESTTYEIYLLTDIPLNKPERAIDLSSPDIILDEPIPEGWKYYSYCVGLFVPSTFSSLEEIIDRFIKEEGE